ncbi:MULTISPECIES: hypothetical protein [Rhizobium]|uniref:Plasmid stabilization protein n=1 Tax=Rhizobium favelukesii TaxID=348824 RepID=W6RLJ1_9HYPH|nr:MULTISPECIES: hypothetical protein [Rhizobium]MCA0806756.1 plasmid stabilization protein [Rhizobium sp. T1473]MCS0462018.1 plasmid stabilization protein [Rhizobium favelukesii]UFS85152.1 plasmid stabilization protein [Rhizobium sp. T136]CDM61120.1 hypothetical protein LPU83_pLPU83c_0558 [Rhizobium favelukesii]
MPRGDKFAYTDKQKRKAEHIEERYEDRGVSEKEAERRASFEKGGRKGGAAAASRTKEERSASGKKAAATRKRNEHHAHH